MITELPYVDKTYRDLLDIYIKNKDITGLLMLINIFTSSTLNHIIEQLDYIFENDIIEDNCNYLHNVRDNYKKFLDII